MNRAPKKYFGGVAYYGCRWCSYDSAAGPADVRRHEAANHGQELEAVEPSQERVGAEEHVHAVGAPAAPINAPEPPASEE